MQLRPYQSAAISAVYAALRERTDNPCVVIPTGGGKTPVIASICNDVVKNWSGRAVVLAHVRELLEQSAEKIYAMSPGLPVGVYSAGLRSRDLGYAITVASIQSIFKRAGDLGPVDLILVDEAHMIADKDDGMYREFIADAKIVNPHSRVVGFTATPFRMRSGSICTDDGILNHVCFEIGVRELIVGGFLSPLKTKGGIASVDTSKLHVRAGEYVASEVEQLVNTDSLVEAACDEIIEYTRGTGFNRNSTLIFASGIAHAEHIVRIFRERHNVECGIVTGSTPAGERREILDAFRSGRLHYLVNVNVLTTGFDAPNVDCVALMRPTLSAGLYYQMVGRGFRMSPGKADCLVLDFGQNVKRHGPVDAIRVRDRSGATPADNRAAVKECPKCHEILHAGFGRCPCGYEFPPPVREAHDSTATERPVISESPSEGPAREEHAVHGVEFAIHYKRQKEGAPPAPPTMRVDYEIGFGKWVSEWVCFEHEGFAGNKAYRWWRQRSWEDVPATVAEAVDLAQCGALAETRGITVEKDGNFDRIVSYKLDAKPPRVDGAEPEGAPVIEIAPEDCPF